MLTRLLLVPLFLSLLVSHARADKDAPDPPHVGQWALKMNNGDAGWLTLEFLNEQWEGQLWSVGQSKTLTNFEFKEGVLSFVRKCRIGAAKFPGGPPTGKRVPCKFVASVQGEVIRLAMHLPTSASRKEPLIHLGKRLPPLPPKPDLTKVTFGDPVDLFNGSDLTGWQISNPKQLNGWKAVDGELVNESPKKTFEPYSRYGNLRTTRTFGDGKLTIEFNVPAGGNSGIYVRGAYEAQVVDRDSRMQGITGVGAIFGRIAPSKQAGKAGGEWQHYEITIVERHASVLLNGELVIDNQPVLGNTNGAFQSDVTIPGPLYLQGDHTAVRYRNIIFRPAIRKN